MSKKTKLKDEFKMRFGITSIWLEIDWLGVVRNKGSNPEWLKFSEVARSVVAVGLKDDGDPNGIRTRIPTVKGWCPNR